MQQLVRGPPPGVAGCSSSAAAGQTFGPASARAMLVGSAPGGQRVAISHQELSKLSSSAAAALRRSGVRADGLVGLALADGSTQAAAYQLGAWQIGAAFVHVPASPKLSRAHLMSALDGVHVVVASAATARVLQSALPTGTAVLVPEELAARAVPTSSVDTAGACADSSSSSDDSSSGSDDSGGDSSSSEGEDSSSSSSSSSRCGGGGGSRSKPGWARKAAKASTFELQRADVVSSSSGSCKDVESSSAKFDEHGRREGSQHKRPVENIFLASSTGAPNKRARPALVQPLSPGSEDCADTTTTAATLVPLPACAAEAEAVVSRVRESRLLGTEKRTDVPADIQAGIAAAKRTMQAALSRLSSDLYSQQCRWVLELLQNADDNDYAVDVGTPSYDKALSDTAVAGLPRVDIAVTRSCLSLVNNERGFTARDVEALCDIGASTKTAETERKRCIGEKGIGFKSVFAISDTPYVLSNYFSFRFEKNAAEGIGSLVPHWVSPQSFPRVDEAGSRAVETPYPGTCIILPLHNTPDTTALKHTNIWKTMQSLDSLVLLFLRQLRVLTVSMVSRVDKDSELAGKSDACHTGYSYRRIIRKEGNPPNVAIRDEHLIHATTESVAKFKVVQYMAPIPAKVLDAAPRHKQMCFTTELACAFPLATDGSADASSLHKLFVFLPTRGYGFRFPLHAEFSLPSSREEVLRDGMWNQWLAREAVVDAFITAVGQTFLKADQRLRTSWYRFIPRRTDLVDNFFLYAHTRIFARLKTMDCIATESESSFRRPRQVVLRTDPQLEQILPNSVLRAALNLEYAAQGTDDGCDGETLVSLGCSKLSHKMLLKCMKHRAFVSEMRVQDDGWLRSLYAVLARHLSSSKWLAVMQQLPLVRLVDGSLCCALREAGSGLVHDGSADTRLIFLPSSELDQWMLSPSLNIVRPSTICSNGKANVDACSSGTEHDDSVVNLLLKLGVCPATPVSIIERYILPHHKRSWAPNTKISYEEALILCIQVSYVKTHLQLLLSQADDSVGVMQKVRDTMLLRSVTRLSSQPGDGAVLACSFMVASRLYLPSDYTGRDQPGLENVFCDDSEIHTVDPCYLGTDPPGLNVAVSSQPEERREAWNSFLQQLGCRVAPELSRKEVLLNPGVAGKRFAIHPRGNVAVCDHVLSPEFRRVLTSGQQSSLGALLALMDRHWMTSYAQRQYCVLEYQQQGGGKRVDRLPASFILELREILRVPTSHGLMPLSQVFCRTPELLRVFGEDSVPFLMPHLELSSLEMKQALGLSGELTTELALAVLRCERSRWVTMPSCPDRTSGTISRVRAAYEILRMRFEQDSVQIHGAFSTEPLIAVPSPSLVAPIRFLLPAQVCWHDDDSSFGTQHGFLERHYSGLENFFCVQLGVSKHLLMRDIADRLVELSLSHHARVITGEASGATLDAAQSLVVQLYQRLNKWLGFANAVPQVCEPGDRIQWPPPEPLDWQCLEHLRCQPIFLSQQGIFCQAQAVIAPDDAELQSLFIASTEGVNLLAMSAIQAVQLSNLLGFFGIRHLSSSVVTTPTFSVDESSTPRHEQWSRKLVACLLPLAQYIHHRQPERFVDLQRSGLLGRLGQTLSVHTIQSTGSLQVRYSLPAADGTGAASCLATRAALAVRMSNQAVALVIDAATVRNDLDQLASELLRLLSDAHIVCADLELTNFTELLLSKQSTRAVDRLLLHRKIPMLAEKMTVDLGLRRVEFSDPVASFPPDSVAASAESVIALPPAQNSGSDDGSDSDDSGDSESDDHGEGAAMVARPVAALHRESAVARQAHQGKAAEVRCAKEEASRIWPSICKGQSEPWRSLSAEFQRINQLGARGGSTELIDVRRPGSEAALATRLHVAAVAEGIGYDVLSVEDAADQPSEALRRLVRIEVKSCAARRSLAGNDSGVKRDNSERAHSTAAKGLNFYMSEAERKMASLYLKSQAFKGDSWKLRMYAPAAGTSTPSDGCGVAVENMVPIDLTDVVASEIVRASPTNASRAKRDRVRTGLLRATEWRFAL